MEKIESLREDFVIFTMLKDASLNNKMWYSVIVIMLCFTIRTAVNGVDWSAAECFHNRYDAKAQPA